MRLAAGDGSDALDEVEDGRCRMPLLGEHSFDDGRGLGLGEAALPQELGAVVVGASDDRSARGLDAADERRRRGVGEARQRWSRFAREAVRGVFRVPDDDLLKVLDAPEIAVLADGAELCPARDYVL